MPELDLKVFFEAIDKLSPVLGSIADKFEGVDKATHAAGRAMKDWGAVAGVALGAHEIGERIDAVSESTIKAANRSRKPRPNSSKSRARKT